MNPALHAFFEWLLRSSWQAAVLTVLVLSAQFCLGKRLDGRWRHLLWFLVLARLVLPWSPPSRASVYNYLHFMHPPESRQPSLPAPIMMVRSEIPVLDAPASRPIFSAAPVAPNPEPLIYIAPKPHWTPPGWPSLLAAAWATGVVILAARLIVQNVLFRRRLRTASRISDQRIIELFEDCRSSMRISTPVALVQTELLETPALYGLWRLRLLLPPDLAERFSSAELRHIFLHELGHVRRQDMLLQWLMTSLQIVHWFNPVLWFGFRRMAADRELACDELALSIVGEGEGPAYGRTIVKLLECCAAPSRLPGLVGILEDKGQIFQRVTMIAHFKRHSGWSILGAAAAAVLGLATLTGAQTEKGPPTNQQVWSRANEPAHSANEINQKVAAIVQDWENLPDIFDDIETYSRQIRELVGLGKPAVPALCAALDHTDHDASLRLLGFTLRAIGDPEAVPALVRAIPKTLRPSGSDCGMSVGDPDLSAFMRSNDLDVTQQPSMPGSFSMGRPVREICGALAKITGMQLDESDIYSVSLEGGEQQRAVERQAYHKVAGHWADWWRTNYQRFGTDPAMGEISLPTLPALDRVATPAHFLTGANVKASGGLSCMILAPLETGQNCCLALSLNRLVNLPPQLSTSNGTVPIETITAWAAKEGVDLLGIRYLDPQSGKVYYCLRGVGLQAWEIPNERWSTIEKDLQRGALPALDTPAGDLLMHYDAALARYVPERKATFLFITRDGSQGILRVPAQVTRKMTERDMGIPYVPPDDSDPNQSSDAGLRIGVRLDYTFFYEETAQMSAESKARQDAATAKAQAWRRNKTAALLEQYPHTEGTVFSPGGQTVSNAAILIGIGGEPAVLWNGRFAYVEKSTIYFTRANGRFTIPHLPHAHAYVAHEEGFCDLNLDGLKSPLSIQLVAWGRIEGNVTLEGKLASHQQLALLDDPHKWTIPGHLNLTYQTESDNQGRFVFEDVPPGEVKVCRVAGNRFCEEQMVEVIEGQTSICQHDFDGRVLKGHFVTSDSSVIANWKNSVSMNFGTKFALLEPPAKEDPVNWEGNFWQPDEDNNAFRASQHFATFVEPNGDFRIEDVPPGTYELRADLYEGRGISPYLYLGGKYLGQLKQEVTIPAPVQGRENSPLDLGTFAVQIKVILRPGDTAPDFSAKTVNGETLRLADFRGKYVLLAFWATWCGPSLVEIPTLKAVFGKYGSNPKFAMVGLSLDKTADAPASYAKTNGLSWAQGYLGDWSETTLPARYGVERIPVIFLLDPDGKIVATDLRGENIQTAVQTALGGN
jgi:beta-lactamase regulating signal transducer with metallopeptidase domain/peroxiredoxin